jgi:hypothetical protein
MAKRRDPDAPTNKIRRHLHKHKRITREEIAAYGWKTQPGLAISYLRYNGYKLPLRITPEGRYWEMTGFEKKQVQQGEDLGPELERHTINCQNCGVTFVVGVWPGDKPNKHQFCSGCRSHPIEGKREKYVPSKTPPTMQSLNILPSSEVYIYKPGDDGFDEIAAQCTHISEIQY